MKVPKAKKVSSGNWYIRMKLGGEVINITRPTEKAAQKAAELIKAEYRNGKNLCVDQKTLSDAIDDYIEKRTATLSPLTIRGYDRIKKYRFQFLMQEKVSVLAKYSADQWQSVINRECKLVSAKTVKNSFAFIKSVVEHTADCRIKQPRMPQMIKAEKAFLTPDEIKKFVATCAGRPHAVSMLLALSSLRISEIAALRWTDVKPDFSFVHVGGAYVQDKDNNWVLKKTAKNASSIRNVPILIPELKEELQRCEKGNGFIMDCSQNTLRRSIEAVCKDAGITVVTPHELRHSFASLSYSLKIPEKICQEIGGWSDTRTMHDIYTHIAQSDISRYQNAIADFYSGKKSD